MSKYKFVSSDSVFVDTLSFTFPVFVSEHKLLHTGKDIETLFDAMPHLWLYIQERAKVSHSKLWKEDKIFASNTIVENMNLWFKPFDLELVPMLVGKNGYKSSFEIISSNHCHFTKAIGHLSWGGVTNKYGFDTVNIYISGYGFQYLQFTDHYQAFIDMLKDTQGSIRRVDLAIDDKTGIYNLDRMLRVYDSNYVRSLEGGIKPSLTQYGDFHTGVPSSSGRTLYFGKRTSSKYMRSYEKGKQLGDQTSSWVRHEVELKASSKFDIPFDVLYSPEQYLRGVFRCFDKMIDDICKVVFYDSGSKRVISYLRDVREKTLNHLVRYGSLSYGGLLFYLHQTGNSFEEIYNLLVREVVPSSLCIV